MRAFITVGMITFFLTGPFSALAENTDKVYRYKSNRGRPAFTNIPEGLEARERETLQELDMSRYEAILDPGAEHDLSHVILGGQLAKKVEKALSSTYASLVNSDYCDPDSYNGRPSLLSAAWRDHGPLIFIAGALALLFLFTPYALKKLGAPQWSKVLLFSIKGMLLVGIVAYVFHSVGSTLNVAQERNELCDRGKWDELEKDPASLPERASLVERFKMRVEAINDARAAKLEQAVTFDN